MPPVSMFVLAVLAGAFIALGAIFSTTVSAGTGALPFGVARLLGGARVQPGADPRRRRRRRALHRQQPDRDGLGQPQGQHRALLLRNWGSSTSGNLVGAVGDGGRDVPDRAVHASAAARSALAALDHRGGQGVARLRAGRRARRAVQRARLPGGVAHLQRPDDRRTRSWPSSCRSRRSSPRASSTASPTCTSSRSGSSSRSARRPRSGRTIGRSAADFPHLTSRGASPRTCCPVTLGNVIGGAVMVGRDLLVRVPARAPHLGAPRALDDDGPAGRMRTAVTLYSGQFDSGSRCGPVEHVAVWSRGSGTVRNTCPGPRDRVSRARARPSPPAALDRHAARRRATPAAAASSGGARGSPRARARWLGVRRVIVPDVVVVADSAR